MASSQVRLPSAEDYAFSRLISYASYQWPGYRTAPHHRLIARHLEAVERGEITRLMITMPPRHGKSLLASEYFPAWYLGRNPEHYVVTATYGQELADDFGRKVRNQIEDPAFRAIFPGVFLASDSKSARRFSIGGVEGGYEHTLARKGAFYAVGVGGPLTGRGADCLVAGTIIETNLGPKRIEDLEHCYDTCHVLSYNHDRAAFEYRHVQAFSKRQGFGIYRITTSAGRVVEVTGDHRVFTIKGYVEARSLAASDRLLCSMRVSPSKPEWQERWDSVKSVERIGEEASVFDIQVSKNHNFFANGILVHNCLLIDDPVKNREEAESEVIRKKTRDWYTSTAYTRLMPGGRVVAISTRWHQSDLVGWLRSEHDHENWVVLDLPAINDDGKALWPEQYDIKALEKIRQAIGPRDWSALYQQQPSPETGDYFKREWIKTTDRIPDLEHMTIYGASDYAVTSNGGDYTVHVILGIDPDSRMYVLDLWRGQTSSDIWVEAFCDLVLKWKPVGWAEESGQIKSGVGPFLVRRMLDRQAYVARETFPTRGDKAVRAQSIRGRMALSGLYVAKDASFLADLVSEMMSFPVGVNDDQCVTGETLISTPHGQKRIDCLEVGDRVMTPEGERRISAHSMTSSSAEIMRVTFKGGYLDCTPSHPVHVKYKGFVRADTLSTNDELTFEGEVCSGIISVRPLKLKRPVYNITVEGEHVYYANGVLTHNCDALGLAGQLLDRMDRGSRPPAPPARPIYAIEDGVAIAPPLPNVRRR